MSTKKKIVEILYFIEFWWESAAALIAIYFSRRVANHLTSNGAIIENDHKIKQV